ncbi:MAG: SgcJ/EcaC family oxidoreductase, partial [Pirellulales bacterium]
MVHADASKATHSRADDERAVRVLYQNLLDAWNRRSAEGMAALFADDGGVVGFDGSTMETPAEIAATLAPIFAHHPTAAYVSIVRFVRFVAPDVALLRAVVGMVPPGSNDINPAVNAVQTLVAVRDASASWRISLLQNTPAAFHGRPEESE